MALLKDEVIVIKGINYSEADKIITVLGKNRGKFSLIAKGVRKIESRNRAAVQTLSIADITFYEGRNLSVLVEADQKFIPEVPKELLDNIGKILKCVNRLVAEEVEEPDLQAKLVDYLNGDLGKRETNKLRIWILEHLGFLPNMRVCHVCGTKNDLNKIDIGKMITVCDACFGKTIGRNSFVDIKEVRYESTEFDEAISKFINKVIDQNDVG